MLVPLAGLQATFDSEIVDKGELPALLLVLSFGATFGLTRFITHSIRSERFSWLGNVEAGDTHIHHLVWGICLLLVAGLLAIAVQPPLEVVAIVFGIGAALTLDEFALWLRLQDVYWSEQGRASIDVVVLAAILGTLAVINSGPLFKGAWWEIVIFVALDLALMVVGLAKGKTTLAIIGLLIPVPIGMIAAIRLAKPDSRWARWRYENKPRKLAKARKRNERWEGRRIRFQNAIAGAPDS